ncbi:MAG: hypothetical protein KF760_04515 [Candidatus Eremiobacteraeota bacterium]|nr:hypothetical protein [Candidatus Eremiobacteraeota bacterium]MCW5866936.1 hypothetical protein [Candidatus Eremiobacteraeota bacterium]
MDEIEKLRAEGAYLDTARFTLDSLKARQKLAGFQLPESGLWLVKLVQAAVVLKAPSITIAFARSTVSVRFEAAKLPEAQDLLNLVMSGQLPQEPEKLHLVTALRSCASATTESVEWHSGGGMVKLDARVTRTGTSEQPGFQLIATRPPRARTLARTLATSVSHLVRNTAEEYEAVAQRCWVCPIPVLLDGRPLQRGYDSPLLRGLLDTPGEVILQYEKSRANLPTFCVGIRQIPPLPGRPALAALESRAELRRPVFKQGTFLRWRNEGDSIGAALTVQCYRDCKQRIDFVWDGAVVASHELEWQLARPKSWLGHGQHHLGLRLVFAVDGAELDLSQFEVRDKAALARQLMEQCKPALLELIEELLNRIRELYYVHFTFTAGKAVGLGLGTYALGGSAVWGAWFLAPFGIAVGGGAYASLLSYRHIVQASLKALREALTAHA